MKTRLFVLTLLCTCAHAQTDDELVTDANLTISYFECAFLAQDPAVRLTFINRGIKVGRIYLNATDSNPNQHMAAIGKMPSEFMVEGSSVDFKLGETYELVATPMYNQLQAKERMGADGRVLRASLFLGKNCSLLPK